MAESKRKTIAIVMGNAISSYSTDLVEGFRVCAKEEDVNLVFLTGPHLPRYCKDILSGSFSWDYEYQFHTIYDYAHYIKPDAVIVAYGLLAQFKYVPNINEFIKKFDGIPCLVLGDQVDDPNIPYLTGGNYHGMKETVEHLIKVHGYKKIGFVAGPRRNFDSNQRLQAYRDTMADAGIEVKESYIVHGSFREVADEEVTWLLDNNPGLEAIVFANDSMAKAGYRVCAARDLVVGHDIAITGYDDTDIAKTLEPPLTSVAHSSFVFSYKALQAALKLCNGEIPASEDLESQFQCRSSCGCKTKSTMLKVGMSVEEMKDFIETSVATMTEELLSSVPYEKDKIKCRMFLELYFSDVIDMVFESKGDEVSFEVLLRYLKRLTENTYISKLLLLEHISRILNTLLEFTEDRKKQKALIAISVAMNKYIHSEEVNQLNLEILQSDRKNWFIPIFTMDLAYGNLDMREQMTCIMTRLQAMGITSAYLLFFGDKVIHKKEESMLLPDKIYLTAHFDEKNMVCYESRELKPVQMHKGFTELLPQDRSHFYTAFPIFSGEEQYGMILCEADQSEYMFTLICSLQLGSLRRIINLNILERQMKQELEEKNRILSVISANDELSQLLNRRGFMEKSLELIRKNFGKYACLLFADIDHLKEINDCFGHAAGDFAIITAADYLRKCMPENAVIARIGGDEYVALVVTDCEGKESCDSEVITRRLEQYMTEFNAACNKPYYVEMSAGICEFVCDKKTDLTELLSRSDDILYEKKKNRKATIKKEIS